MAGKNFPTTLCLKNSETPFFRFEINLISQFISNKRARKKLRLQLYFLLFLKPTTVSNFR